MISFISTRANSPEVSASEAILQGLAPDGGLYVPKSFPLLKKQTLTSVSSYPELAFEVLFPFFEGDVLEPYLAEICMDAFNFPIEIKNLGSSFVLELFHGPTAAFKDFGARFLACCMEKLLQLKGEEITILVATSGDTGGAVASAFYSRKGIKVKVLFPKGGVSPLQRQQLTCWGGNIESYEVEGTFDDCQAMVKQAFMDKSIKGLSSANSINLGRLLPQSVYYVYSSLCLEEPTLIIPTGNAGNCCAAYWAMMMGCRFSEIALAENSNSSIVDYLKEKSFRPRPSIKTLANAMDVGSPSNMERLMYMFQDYFKFVQNVSAACISDEEIKATIKAVFQEEGYVMCPHTATAEAVRRKSFADRKNTVVVSTAHPAKFREIVQPVIGEEIPLPLCLETLLERKAVCKQIKADYHNLFTE